MASEGVADDDVDRVCEIERLAALESVAYEVARAGAAKRLGMRASALDRELKKKRRQLRLEPDEDDGQGRAVKIIDEPPWPEPVQGDLIATALRYAVKRHIVVSDAAADTIALWVLHTYLLDEFSISPRLAITAPTRGCGKTTVLRLVSFMARRPKRAGSISPAALFRVVEQFRPTILLDETEKYIEHGSELHGLLNEGHARGGTVLRVLGEKLELREFGVFGAVALARTGRLPDDLEERSIVIEMQRRRADEEIADLGVDRPDNLVRLARMAARWAQDHAGEFVAADPDMSGLINRVRDNWRPLFAIATVVGADWPQRVREAGVILGPRESESIGPMLLADIRVAFDAADSDRLPSADLCAALRSMEGRPWADWKGKELTTNHLARLLKPFGVAPQGTIRVGTRTPKGYYRHQFEGVWERYLAGLGGTQPPPRHNADEIEVSGILQPPQLPLDVAVANREKPNNDGLCGGVAVAAGGVPPDEAAPEGNGAPFPRVCVHCGSPERPDQPVGEVSIGGDTYLLHERCREDWLAAEDH